MGLIDGRFGATFVGQPWVSHGRPKGRPREAHGKPMRNPWATHGKSMGDPRAIEKQARVGHGRPMGQHLGEPQVTHERPMGQHCKLMRDPWPARTLKSRVTHGRSTDDPWASTLNPWTVTHERPMGQKYNFLADPCATDGTALQPHE